MIVLFVDPDCEDCRAVREAVEDLAVAHRVVDARAGDPPGPHAMVDCGELVRGHGQMLRHVEELGKFVQRWHIISADACYCFEED